LPLQAAAALIVITNCGGSSAPPLSPSPGSGGVIQISGRERLGWNQLADDISLYRFAVYVDGRRIDLPLTTCSASPSELGFECTSPLPPLTVGRHVLEVVSWIMIAGKAVESPKAASLTIIVTGATAPADHVQ
jgi:hypothetical protein